jgi:pimeloyl-ACP methyl ester carboxylesterase
VLLHGLFGAARNFGAIQRALATRHRVIALDLRDHGESPHAPIAGYAELAADVRETLAARDALPATVVGHSMGGKVAMRLALDAPDAVSRLVVADIAPVRYPPHFAGYAAAMAALPITADLTRSAADQALQAAVPDRAVRLFLLQNLRTGAQCGWRIGLDHLRAALPLIEDWPAAGGATYAGPTLFLTGERSDYVQADQRGAIRALFPAARFVSLRNAGHWLHVDNPAGFIGVIEAFVPS